MDPVFDVNVATRASYIFNWEGKRLTSLSESEVTALALQDGLLYVGGHFSEVNGIIRRRSLAAVSAETGLALPFDPDLTKFVGFGTEGYPASVTTLLVTNNLVFAKGEITQVNETTPGSNGPKTRLNIAQFDMTTGVATNWDPNAGAIGFLMLPRAMMIRGAEIFVGGRAGGGDCNCIGGQGRPSGVAKIDLETGKVLPWNPDFGSLWSGTVNSLAIVGSTVYVGGRPNPSPGRGFGATVVPIHAVNAAIQNWSLGDQGTADAMVLDGNVLYCGFRPFGVSGGPVLRAVDRLSGELLDWRPAADLGDLTPPVIQNINTVCISGEKLLCGGAIVAWTPKTRHNLAALDLATGTLLDWELNVTSDLRAPQGTSNDPSYNAQTYVRSLLVHGERLFIGGTFNYVGALQSIAAGGQVVKGMARTNLAVVNLETRQFEPASHGVNGPVYALAGAGSNVFVGGDFSIVDGRIDREFLAAFDGETGQVSSNWTARVDNFVRALATDDTNIYVGGHFNLAQEVQPRNGIAGFSLTTGALTPFDPNVQVSGLKAVRSLLVHQGRLYAGGDFSGPAAVNGGTARYFAAAFDIATGQASPWNPDFNNSVHGLLAHGDTVIAIGDFTEMSAQTSALPRRGFSMSESRDGSPAYPEIQPGLSHFKEGAVRALYRLPGVLLIGGDGSGFSHPSNPHAYDLGNPPGWRAMGNAIFPMPALGPTLSVRVGKDQAIRLQFQSDPGASYRLDYKDDLNAPAWLSLTNVTANSIATEVSDLFSNRPRRFYRLSADIR